MRELLETLNRLCGPDCSVKSYDGWNLGIHSGTSLEYAKPLVIFSGVSYLSCPFEFSHPKFRLASNAERQVLEKMVPLDKEDFAVAIEAETMANLERHLFFVVASSASLSAGA